MGTAAAKRQIISDPGELSLEAERLTADALGRLMEFWGFRRHMGRIWAVLYLSPRPLTTGELSSALQLSASAVSLSLAELSRWGAVRKRWQPGDRKDFYEAESSVWKLLRRVFERRELTWVHEASEAFAQAERSLEAARADATDAELKRLDYMKRRVSRLRTLTKVGERLLRTLVAGRVLDPAQVQEAEE